MKRFVSAICSFLFSMEIYVQEHYIEVVLQKILIFAGTLFAGSVLLSAYPRYKIEKLFSPQLRDFFVKIALSVALGAIVFLTIFIFFGKLDSIPSGVMMLVSVAAVVLFAKLIRAKIPKNSKYFH